MTVEYKFFYDIPVLYLQSRSELEHSKFRETLRAGSVSDQVTFNAWQSSSRVEVCGYPFLGYIWRSCAQSSPTLGQLLTEQAYFGTTLDRAGSEQAYCGTTLDRAVSEQAYSGTTLDRAGSEMLTLLRGSKKSTIWSVAHIDSDGFDQSQKGSAERKRWST